MPLSHWGKQAVMVSLSCVASGAVGWSARGLTLPLPAHVRRLHLNQPGFRFTNPLLDCDAADNLDNRELRPFTERVESVVAKARGAGRAEHVSVYFRDLNNGPWFGLEEDAEFSPASLLKVPTLMALLRAADREPGLMDRQVVVPPDDDENDQLLAPANPVVPGRAYPLTELAQHMIIESDNNAYKAIRSAFTPESLKRTYSDLGLDDPTQGPAEGQMSVREYASFFRILYNGSYLRPASSESALRLLSFTAFKDGLAAGVPEGTAVAHKFGERNHVVDEDTVLHQFHDCGVVYYPRRPYVLCVMTRGKNVGELIGTIREISRTVYDSVAQQTPAEPAVN